MANKREKISQLLSLIICFLMILAISIGRDHKWLGHELISIDAKDVEIKQTETMSFEKDGIVVINTSIIAKGITGYGGSVPLEIRIKDGTIIEVKDLKNYETPVFFNQARTLLSAWNGKTLDEASTMQVDAVTGATFSSRAIIENMHAGVNYALNKSKTESFFSGIDFNVKNIASLIVVLMAAILPLFIKNKIYRICQQALNVIVLGFWCGQMLSYSSIISYVSNGVNLLTMLVPSILLIIAFIYPLFNKKNYYCANVCPFGSLQELSGRCIKHKISLSNTVINRIKLFRQILWAVLMLCLWTGVWMDWINYEPFSAFILGSASWVVICIAILFIGLSTVVTRPYCRWVCPLGMLFKISQSNK